MTHSTLKITLITALTISFSNAVNAQDTAIETLEVPVKKRVVRVVEPVPYWVKADRLRVRDNPFAGDVVDILEAGKKVKAYERADNWVRISAAGKPAKWINSKFLTNDQVTWSNYSFGKKGTRYLAETSYDVILKRIKVKEMKGVKIYAAQVKTLRPDTKSIITRHDFREGPYYERRLVSCDASGAATHVRLLGEGYNYAMMQKDPRNASVSEAPATEHAVSVKTSPANQKIAEFACKTSSL